MKKLNHRVLAEGEATGHAHRADGGVLYASEDERTMVLDASEGNVTIKHEEHGDVTVGGRFRVGRVQEMDHAAEEARQVQD